MKKNFRFMLLRQKYINSIIDNLTHVQGLGKKGSRLNLHDTKLHTENFLRDLFNLIYGYNLTNANKENSNQPAIDLIGENICYQITFENTSEKIKETKQKYSVMNKSGDCPQLIIFIFDDKPRGRKDPYVHYIDDLTKYIYDLPIDRLKEIDAFLGLEIQKVLPSEKRLAIELDAIHRIIIYLSEQSNSSVNNTQESQRPIPNKKIYLRFREYANCIEEEFADYIAGNDYGTLIAQAKQNYVDDGNSNKIKNYLRWRSRELLISSNKDAKKALDELVTYIMDKAQVQVAHTAVRFYLLNELMECDIFPLTREEQIELGGNHVSA
jgi:hypothetical protein